MSINLSRSYLVEAIRQRLAAAGMATESANLRWDERGWPNVYSLTFETADGKDTITIEDVAVEELLERLDNQLRELPRPKARALLVDTPEDARRLMRAIHAKRHPNFDLDAPDPILAEYAPNGRCAWCEDDTKAILVTLRDREAHG